MSQPINTVPVIRALCAEIDTALREQQRILQMRNLTLPPNTFTLLDGIAESLAEIESRLVADATELSQLRALVGTYEQINSSLDLDEVLSEAMDTVIALTGAERGYIALTNPFEDEIAFRIARDPELAGGTGFGGSRALLNDVLATGDPLLADNAYKDPRFSGDDNTVARLTLRSVLCVPLKVKDRVIGAVYVDNRLREGIFTDRELKLLTAFANQTAIAIENARLFARVQSSLAAITEMKDLMDSIFVSIGSGVITTDADNLVTGCNRAAEGILDLKREAALNQSLPTLLPKINVDFEAHLRAVRQQDQRAIIEAELDRGAHGRVALNLKISPLRDGRAGLAVVLDDLTDQRDHEEMLNVLRRYLPPEMIDNIEALAALGLGGERREITCIFVDVRPLATFPSDMRPRDIMEQLNQHLTVATECIHDNEGVIDKYMGHEVMGLFNSQLNPQPGHARQALEAALDMGDAFCALYERLGIAPEPHFYRIGMHTGVATLGNVGSLSRRDFTAIGDTINLAKRLEENATAGQIILSADTVHAAGEAMAATMQFVQRDSLQVKGRQQRTPIYEVYRR
jgi:class 3 adenylate cyclase